VIIDIVRNYSLQSGHIMVVSTTRIPSTNYTLQTGHITIVPTARIPKRIILTANCFHGGSSPINSYTCIVDVLLVPISFNMETCFNLYRDQFYPVEHWWYMGMRTLRDNVILLRRMAVRGFHVTCATKQLDISEDVRARTDHKLVVTCPVLHSAGMFDHLSLFLLLEMEF